MKEQILKIAKALENGTITTEQAQTLLLGLLGVSTRFSLRWGNTPHNLNMVFISDMVDSPQKAIDEFYECYPDAFCDHPKPYSI